MGIGERTTTYHKPGVIMTPEQAQSKIDNLMAQYVIALCSRQDVEGFINYIDIMWKYSAIPNEDKYGNVRSYTIVDRNTFE